MKYPKLNSLFLFLLLISSPMYGQEKKPKLDQSNSLGSATRSEKKTIKCLGLSKTESADLKWQSILVPKNEEITHHDPDEELIEQIKAEKLEKMLKFTGDMPKESESANKGNTLISPVVDCNFAGNPNNGFSPLDNSMAISNNGWVVSVVNASIEYHQPNGELTYYNDLLSFVDDSQVNRICDPLVIYDSGEDRFVFFAQECPSPLNSANTHLLLMFSKTNNPNDGWWSYKFTGNPLNDNSAFDYPKIGVSNNELFVTGNLYFDNGALNQSVIYQFDKLNAFDGGPVDWWVWHDIPGSPFTLLPVSYGQGGTYGPGMYFVASLPGGGSSFNLYDLTDDLYHNPSLFHYSISTDTYTIPGDALQLNTSQRLKNGSCRTLSGFYLQGTIHFVFHSDDEDNDGWSRLNYNRLNLNTMQNTSSTFGLDGYNYAYPAVSSFAWTWNEKGVLLGFQRSSTYTYPEMRVVYCDNNMNWSNSVQVKGSESFIGNSSTGATQRWGDYTGISRQNASWDPEVWVSGSYATGNHFWNTWIAQIKYESGRTSDNNDNQLKVIEIENPSDIMVYPNPIVSTFTVEFTLPKSVEIDVNVVDINGRIVQDLYHGKALDGTNVFAFNKANLSSGIYFLKINTEEKEILKEKIVISD